MSLDFLDMIDDDTLAELPTGTVPVVEALAESQRNDVTDLTRMERKLDEYKEAAPALKTLHKAWVDANSVWGKRVDEVYGKVSAVDTSLAISLGVNPGEGYEPFELVSLPAALTTVTAFLGAGASGYGAYKGYQNYKAAKAAKNAGQAVQSQHRWAKTQGALAAVGFVISGYVAVQTLKDRTDFLIVTLEELEVYFLSGTEQIATMKMETEGTFIADIREIAMILGVDDPDNNQMYHNVIGTLSAAMTDAAEVEAQYKVATRMLCEIPGRTPPSYNVADTAVATGLIDTVVQARANEIEADTEGLICAPYQPTS